MALIPIEEYFAQQRAKAESIVPSRVRVQPGPAPTEQPGFISAPFERGLRGAQADLTAAAGLMAQQFGFDELSQGLYDKANEYAQARDAIPRRVPRMEDIEDMGDLGVFAIETLVENAPMLAAIAIPGGIAGKAAAMAGAGVRAAQTTGLVASFLTDVGLQTGESIEIARNNGIDPGDIRVIGSGIGKGILDFVPMLTIARRLGMLKGIPLGPIIEKEISKRLVEGGFLSRVAGEVGTIAAREVPTEVAQEAINIALDRSMTQFQGQLTPEEISQLKNAAAGAAAFSLLGLPSAFVRPATYDEDETEVDALQDGSAAAALPPPERMAALALEDFDRRGAQRALPAPVDYYVGSDGQAIPNALAPKPIPEAGSVLTVAPDGTISPANFPLPPRLGNEKQGDLRNAIRQQLQAAKETQNDPAVLFKDDGSTEIDFAPEALDLAARSVVTLAAELRSQIDNSILITNGVLQEGKKRKTRAAATPQAQDPTTGRAEGWTPLLSARDEILADQDLRTKKGELNATGRKRLAAVEARIVRAAEVSGAPNPLSVGLDIRQDVEAELTAAAVKETQATSNLTPGETEYVNRLEQKEVVDGLTDEEETTLQALYLKRIQRPRRVKPRRLTAQELRALEDAPAFEVTPGPEAEAFLSEGVEPGVMRARQRQHFRWNKDEEFGGEVIYDPHDEYPGYVTRTTPAEDVGQVATGEGQFEGFVGREEGEYRSIGLYKSNAEAKDAVERELGKGQVMHSKRDAAPKARFSVEQVANAVRTLTKNFPNKPTFIVTPNSAVFRNVPKRAHLAAEKYSTTGMFFRDQPDTVYIFSDRIRDTQHLAKTLLHEMLHFGMHNFMDAAERRQLLAMISKERPEVWKRVEQFHDDAVSAYKKNPSAANAAEMRSRALYEAEEIIAEMAEKDPKASLLDRVVALLRRALRRLGFNLKISDAELKVLIRDVGAWRRKTSAVTERNYAQVSEPFRKREFEKLVGRSNTYQAETLSGIHNWGEVWGQKFLNGVLTPLQMANSAFVKNTLPSAGLYLEFVQKWWARKRNLTDTPTQIAEDWSKFGKRDAEKLSRVFFEISIESDELGRRLTDSEIVAIFKANGLDPSTVPRAAGLRVGSRNVFEIWRDADKSFQEIVDQMEKGIQISLIRQGIRERGVPDPLRDRAQADELAKLWRSEATHTKFFERAASTPAIKDLNLGGRLLAVEAQMKQLRDRNYFPRMRFGKYAITVRAKSDLVHGGKQFRGPTQDRRGEVVWFETHENPGAQAEGQQRLVKEFGGKDFEVQSTRLSDNEFVFLGMPPALYEVLRGELGLSTEQEERLKEIYRKFSPGTAFLKHLIRRKDIAGFSTDAIRIYASYMMNAANHLARVEFHQDLGDSLNNIRRESNLPINATRAGEVREYFARHFNYLMNPTNDWARLRSLGFLWYLGFNVKSALVNLTQVPMVAYPFLAHHYGDKAAIAAISKAYSDVAKMRRGRKVLDAEADRDLARAITDGFIDESRATELAGLAEGDALQRVMPEGKSAKIINKASYYGAFLFRHAEKVNRETVFLAARELAKQRGLKGEAVYRAAREAVQTTMFEYAKWNRPEFMRGKKSVFFLFMNYMQHMAYLAYGGEGGKVAMRIWLGLMLAAGVQGLPFAENFFDIFDWSATSVKEIVGAEDTRTAVRDDIRALANTITDEPDLIMHGLGRYYGLGPMHFLSLFDVPVPNVDVSSSLSAGEVIPGLREAFAAGDDPDAKLGKVMVDAFGPVIGVGYNLWRASVDNNPDTWKVWERAMPSAISGVSKAFRRGQTGQESFRGGGALVKFEPQNMEHRMENIAQAFGFAPSRLNQRQELRYSQEQLKQYWVTRQAAVMENYAYAVLAKDPEAVDLATKKLREFNKAVPSPVLKISQDSLHRSITERYRRATLREFGIPAENRFRPLYRRTEQLYPEGSAAIPTRY